MIPLSNQSRQGQPPINTPANLKELAQTLKQDRGSGKRENGEKRNSKSQAIFPLHDPRWFAAWLCLAVLVSLDVFLCHSLASLHALLPALASSVLLIILSAFDIPMTVREHEIPLSMLLAFGMGVLLAIALPLAEGKPAEVGIYVMGLAALVVGIRHLTDIQGTSKGIQAAGENLKETQGRIAEQADVLKAQTEDITAIRNLIGFSGYRKQLVEAYRTAKMRIVSVVRLWEIDNEWWEEEDLDRSWSKCPTYASLHDANGAQIQFIGRMAWPCVGTDGTVSKLSEFEFHLLLGITWRLVVLAKVRKALKEQDNRRMRVLVAHVPVPVTVVDFKVGMLVGEPKGETLTSEVLGSFLTKEPYDDAAKALAHTYNDLVEQFLAHSGAMAGEHFVASVLYLMGLCCGYTPVWDVEAHLPKLLEDLGFERWARAARKTEEKHKERVVQLFREFLVEYYAHDSSSLSQLTFNDLKEALT